VFDSAKILFVCVQKIKIMVRVRYIFGSLGLWTLPMVWYSEQGREWICLYPEVENV
jgi:hypothetical protein